MTRVQETNEALARIGSGTKTPIEVAGIQVELLVEVARSLAVIADSLTYPPQFHQQ